MEGGFLDLLPCQKVSVSCCGCLGAKSCLTLCDPMDWSPPGFSVHGILQARILEWVAISFSRDSSGQLPNLPLWHWQVNSLLLSPGKLLRPLQRAPFLVLVSQGNPFFQSSFSWMALLLRSDNTIFFLNFSHP